MTNKKTRYLFVGFLSIKNNNLHILLVLFFGENISRIIQLKTKLYECLINI